MKQNRDWTQAEVSFLKKNWKLRNDFLAERLDRTVQAVKSKKHKLSIDEDMNPKYIPEQLSQDEKVWRIVKKAAEMRVRLLG